MGYAHEDDKTTFLFDPNLYNLADKPKRVVVTGAFRDWSEDMDAETWQLSKQQELWTLTVKNQEMSVITPASPFKFRVNDGQWLNPPSEASNNQGGNLVFMHEMEAPELKAEIRDEHTIWASINGVERSLKPEDYVLRQANGSEIPIQAVLPNTAAQTLISTAEPIDIERAHYLEMPSEDLKTAVSYDGWFRRLYSDKELGAIVSDDRSETTFRLFAPRADSIRLMLYPEKEGGATDSALMKMDEDRVWEASFSKDMKGTWYDFKVFGPEEPGSHFYQQTGETVSDPYSLVNDDAWGRSRVWYDDGELVPLEDGIPAMEDVVAYEVHVQDFTDRLPVDESIQGTFPAMIEPNLKNDNGEPIGFDYLLDLGINVVHLMPVQEYLHYPDEEWKESFADDSLMQKYGISEENYQWGYRTTHALAVENRFRSKGSEHGTERQEFRELVNAFHEKGIAVIIDIVPNHTGENMDMVNYYFNFNGIDKSYYYRTKNFEHIGGYGNEVKTENRPMVQRWLIDQCLHYIEEFGVDGFRVDLAGQIDEQTLTALKKAIGDDKIVYGEPWIASEDPEYENNPSWDWYKVDSPITFFQDDARNAFKGPAFLDPENPEPYKERGYAGGFTDERHRVTLALQNYFPEEDSPLDGINYLDIHDNWALADQFAEENWDGTGPVMEDRVKLAATLLFTSQGPLVLHGGTEMLRAKGYADLYEIVKETVAGRKIYIHGKRDTYNLRVPNQFVWDNVGLVEGEQGSPNDYEGMHAFWKSLISFRLSDHGTIFRNRETIPRGFYDFFLPEDKHLLGYVVDNKVAVVLNVSDESKTFEGINLPEGKWQMIGNLEKVDPEGVKGPRKFRKLKGGKNHTIELDGTSFYMWMKE